MLELLMPFTERLKEYDTSTATPNAGGGPQHVVEEKPLDDKLPSVVTDAGRDTLEKETKSKKGIINSQPRETTMCSLIIRQIPVVKSVQKT